MAIPPEPVDFDEIFKNREKDALESIHQIDHEELIKTVNEAFPDTTHPWAEKCLKFIETHRNETAYKGEVEGIYHFVVCPDAKVGFWYEIQEHVRGMGILGERAVTALSEVITKKREG